MKKVEAIIQPYKVDEVKEALKNISYDVADAIRIRNLDGAEAGL